MWAVDGWWSSDNGGEWVEQSDNGWWVAWWMVIEKHWATAAERGIEWAVGGRWTAVGRAGLDR